MLRASTNATLLRLGDGDERDSFGDASLDWTTLPETLNSRSVIRSLFTLGDSRSVVQSLSDDREIPVDYLRGALG